MSVIKFPGTEKKEEEKKHFTAEEILSTAKDIGFTELVVIGWKEDGDSPAMITNMSSLGDINWLLDTCKDILLAIQRGEYEDE